ncbi:glycosyl hydrolase family 92-domain-containing protein [Talaromyces proteolyticus]|uniref:Glycosyl hydrolase family 92-domain-containing protein n=1 Tax=Talaromyces proteolyticus TaxID=1131652 RepID=A0AAD4PXV9_9EURO|nr:glycosyl hydrolase family 92-domain-containing protein [Talaromyces proteolyticus]KAH8697079.1 glycosyl hydrolase family 92-domain-containing protein [Talaromyces proteolyticus]
MANKPGKQEDCETYVNRSSNWKNMLRSDQNSTVQGFDTGFNGFLQPKYENGSWGERDPAMSSPTSSPNSCLFNDAIYFTDRLSFLHFSNLVNIGDHQAFPPVYQFHYTGRPGLSTQRARAHIDTSFNGTISGIPGDEDSGAMGSFVVFTMLSIWPVLGEDVYLLSPPAFSDNWISHDFFTEGSVLEFT